MRGLGRRQLMWAGAWGGAQRWHARGTSQGAGKRGNSDKGDNRCSRRERALLGRASGVHHSGLLQEIISDPQRLWPPRHHAVPCCAVPQCASLCRACCAQVYAGVVQQLEAQQAAALGGPPLTAPPLGMDVPQAGLVWVTYMRFLRRTEGTTPARMVGGRAVGWGGATRATGAIWQPGSSVLRVLQVLGAAPSLAAVCSIPARVGAF